jgi:hypothetical protein
LAAAWKGGVKSAGPSSEPSEGQLRSFTIKAIDATAKKTSWLAQHWPEFITATIRPESHLEDFVESEGLDIRHVSGNLLTAIYVYYPGSWGRP